MGDDRAEFEHILSGFDVGQELVSVELNIIHLGAGVVLLEYLPDSEAVEFWRAIWGEQKGVRSLCSVQQQLTKVSTAQALALTAIHEPEMRAQ